jgi:hypothetical protein
VLGAAQTSELIRAAWALGSASTTQALLALSSPKAA